jgi:hypothetical protein
MDVSAAKSSFSFSFGFTLPEILFSWQKKGFSKKEKEDFFAEKKRNKKPFKVGLIRTKDLDTYVNVMGEIFDFSKTAARKNNKATLLHSNEPVNVKEYGFNMTGNSQKEELIPVPEFYYVSKDFDRLYLGWLDKENVINPKTKAPMTEDEKRIVRTVMKQLFRFMFGKKKIIDVNDFFSKLSYTDLQPDDKIPCENNILVEHLQKSLEYRRALLKEEIHTASKAYNKTIYLYKKQLLEFEIVQLLKQISAKTKCISYEYDPTMKKEISSIEDETTTRLIKVFKDYVSQKKFKDEKYTLDNFRDSLKATSSTGEKDTDLYKELVNLLTSMSNSEEQKAGLEDLVSLMSFLMIIKNALFKIKELLMDINHDLEGEQQERAKKSLLKEVQEIYEKLKQITQTQNADELKGSLPQLLTELSKALIEERPVEGLINEIEEKTEKQQGGFNFNSKSKSKIPAEPKLFCEGLLSLLLLEVQKDGDFDVQDFLNNAGASVDDLGQCPLVVDFLSSIIDSLEEKSVKKGITYYPISQEPEKLQILEKTFHNRFNDSQKEFLIKTGKPVILFPKPPRDFEEYMGTKPYVLQYHDMEDMDEVPLHVENDLEENIFLTSEEQGKIEKGGIPYGALMLLYLTALRDFYRLNESPDISSKCLTPIRTIERSRTPKSKEKKVLRKTRKIKE